MLSEGLEVVSQIIQRTDWVLAQDDIVSSVEIDLY